MDISHLEHAINTILSVIPEQAIPFCRLRELVKAGPIPTVTVIGKYNHGKSRLLNELIGADIFSVADKRETTILSEHLQHHVRWLDAPGLDADVETHDDQHAQHAIWTKADIRLFIHSLREGEFDPREIDLFEQLNHDQHVTQRQTLVVLTQIDQIQDTDILSHIIERIQTQIPARSLWPVSATRHRKAIHESKQILLKRSGIPELQHDLSLKLQQVPFIRAHEKTQIFAQAKAKLLTLQTNNQITLHHLTTQQKQQRKDFDDDLNTVLEKICEDLKPILMISGQDHSLEPDSFANMYKVTAGKIDRNRIQVAYSRACIDLNSHLVRYGVIGLPDAQKTYVRSIDTVIVAVLGVSVKLRKDLDQIFFQDSGRKRLRREFSHYFEISTERQRVQATLHDLEQQKVAIDTALQQLNHLEIRL